AGGITTCAKSTGTLPRMIFPDGSEYPVFRPVGTNVIEQVRIVAIALANGAKALVLECMALQPQLQWLSEAKLIRATIGVITNVRADHLDVMGPTERDVALAMAATTPVKGKLFLGDPRHAEVFRYAAEDRGTELIQVSTKEIGAVTEEEMARFSYIEHRQNVALALRVCRELGVDRQTALEGMWRGIPDPGVTTIYPIRFFGRQLFFVNGFSANDPESTQSIWNRALDNFPKAEKRILIINCRADRPYRTKQFAEACGMWRPADYYMLIGSGTYVFTRGAATAGIPVQKLIFAENRSEQQIFEKILEVSGRYALLVGVANIKEPGMSLLHYFRNRSIRPEGVQWNTYP
ncbi:MAG TPA: poly-gamma-glutamate synthase PgsB, partial [Thermodesulfobacteriota bacterium]|nr:poly-gamma-glutamate synthase PgsB [Thermodesulfobacteriota bacterium]